MLQRLLIALAQVKAGNNSDYLLNEIRQIDCSLNQFKEMTKKVYNNISQYNDIALKYKQWILYLWSLEKVK